MLTSRPRPSNRFAEGVYATGVGLAWGERASRLMRELAQRSRQVPLALERNLGRIMAGWVVVAGALFALRAGFPVTPYRALADVGAVALQYGAMLVAPVLGCIVASGSFPRGLQLAQPEVRFCRYGTWRTLTLIEARQSQAFGPSGFMASLLVGLLLNVPVRAFEFVLAMPVIGPTGPIWAHQLAILMSADVAIMSFFYAVCFVAALRSSPYFPRLLLLAWLLDIGIQLQIAHIMGASPDLPAGVSSPLRVLLEGNIKKVCISVVIWLPYLIVSDRVNRTYRMRERVPVAA